MSKKVQQVKSFEGIMTCIFEHEVAKTSAIYEWTGPKISRECWSEVLAFFKWSYDLTKGETQVRLFVNHRTRVWKAWAFPQRARTGMTTRELETPETQTQRMQFSDQDGWLYYGTVHHHCSAGAFQSSVDEENEKGQDGIHFTVGHLDKQQYDIDARLYQSKMRLELKDLLTTFWDVGDPLSGIPDHIKALMPDDYAEKFAKLQMGTPAPADATFPEAWRANLIYEAPVVHIQQRQSWEDDYKFNHMSTGYYERPYHIRSMTHMAFDDKKAVTGIIRLLACSDVEAMIDMKEIIDIAERMKKLSIKELNVVDIMVRSDVKPDRFYELMEKLEEKLLEQELEEEINGKRGKLVTGGHQPMADLQKSKRERELQQEMDMEHGHPMYPGYGAGFGIGG